MFRRKWPDHKAVISFVGFNERCFCEVYFPRCLLHLFLRNLIVQIGKYRQLIALVLISGKNVDDTELYFPH